MARWRFPANFTGKVGKVVLFSLPSAEGHRGATPCHGNHLGNHLRFQAQTSWFPARKVVPGREEAGKLESGRWPTTRRLKKWGRVPCAFFTPYAWRDQTCGTAVNMGLSWVGPLCARSQARSCGGVQSGRRDRDRPPSLRRVRLLCGRPIFALLSWQPRARLGPWQPKGS